jgi:hypothetical protein
MARGKTFAFFDRTLLEKFAVDIATTASFQADMTAWDPERNQTILIECKQYKPKARFSLLHDLGHHFLSHGNADRTDVSSQSDDPEWLAFEHLLAVLASGIQDVGKVRPAFSGSPASSNDESPEGIRPGEPVWLSWTRRTGSHLRRLPAKITTGIPAFQDRDAAEGRVSLLQAVVAEPLHRMSVTFGTVQLARDYRAARLLRACSVLVALRIMLARIVSALACQPGIPTFPLVLLAAVRHYGHRGESDHHSLLASVLKPPRTLGAACLVT